MLGLGISDDAAEKRQGEVRRKKEGGGREESQKKNEVIGARGAHSSAALDRVLLREDSWDPNGGDSCDNRCLSQRQKDCRQALGSGFPCAMTKRYIVCAAAFGGMSPTHRCE